MSVFPFIEAEKAQHHDTVKRSCELLEVSKSAFYVWHQHRPSTRQLADEQLGERIEAIFEASRGTYGWPRVHRALRREGVHASRKRVARIMRQKGLIGRCQRRWTTTTVSDPDVVAADLVKRVFGVGTVELDRVYVGDITYIWTWEGWLYLATVIDLASRRVVGWSMADHMRTELVADALRMAISARRPGPGLVFHSDRGTQAVHVEGVHRPAGPPRDRSVPFPTPPVLGQRGRGKLLRLPQDRAAPPPQLGDEGPRPPGPVRLHRGVLQPPALALVAGLSHAGRARRQDPPPPRGRSRGIVRLSVEPGQPQPR